jgi:hypothetical protein
MEGTNIWGAVNSVLGKFGKQGIARIEPVENLAYNPAKCRECTEPAEACVGCDNFPILAGVDETPEPVVREITPADVYAEHNAPGCPPEWGCSCAVCVEYRARG